MKDSSIKFYFLPNSPVNALELLQEGRGRYVPIGGGTSFTFRKPRAIEGIVDLSRTGLDFVKEMRGSLHIGATTPIGDLLKLPVFFTYYGGVVKEAARTIATMPLRNLITVGGNVLQVYPWASLPPLFLALGARFRIAGAGNRTIKADEFFSSQPRRLLGTADILKEIILPADAKGAAGAFVKFAKTETDFALLSVAVVLHVENGLCRNARIVVGAATPLPVRLQKAERVLKNQPLTDEVIERAAIAGGNSLQPVKDFRVRDGYKKQITPVIIKRCISSAASRLKDKVRI